MTPFWVGFIVGVVVGIPLCFLVILIAERMP